METALEKYRREMIEAIEKRQEFFNDADGYVYYWPVNGQGHLSAAQLRIIADELDKRNKPWDDQIAAYFEGKEASDGTA